MEEHNHRFYCIPEPSGTWMVWDNETGEPANLGGCVLKGRTEDRARAACEILKRIYKNRLDAHSMHQEAKPDRFATRKWPARLRLVQG